MTWISRSPSLTTVCYTSPLCHVSWCSLLIRPVMIRFPLLWQRLMVVSSLRNHYFPPVKWQWEVSRADRGNVYLFIDRNQMEDFPSGKEGEDLAVGPCLVGWLKSLNSFKSYRLHASNQNLLACQTFICQIYNNIVYSRTYWQCLMTVWVVHGSSNFAKTPNPKHEL